MGGRAYTNVFASVFFHTVRIGDVLSGDVLNIEWADKSYEKQEADFIIGVDVEGFNEKSCVDNKYSHVVKILLVKDRLVLKNYNGDYLEMEKVADEEISEGLLDLSWNAISHSINVGDINRKVFGCTVKIVRG